MEERRRAAIAGAAAALATQKTKTETTRLWGARDVAQARALGDPGGISKSYIHVLKRDRDYR